MKAPTLADFIVEFTPTYDQQCRAQGVKEWVVRMDGSSTQHVGGNGVVLRPPEGDYLECAVCLHFSMTNNKVEYENIIKGLNLAKALEAESLVI